MKEIDCFIIKNTKASVKELEDMEMTILYSFNKSSNYKWLSVNLDINRVWFVNTIHENENMSTLKGVQDYLHKRRGQIAMNKLNLL